MHYMEIVRDMHIWLHKRRFDYTSWLSALALDLFGRSSGAMWGTTPPWEMTTSLKSLLNLTLTRRELISATDVRHRHSLFIVSDGKLKVSRHNATFLVIARGVAGELKDFRSQVLQYGSEVDFIYKRIN